ncbi:MAG: tellurite resistance TerB family protein [Thiotrichales bacterium]
MLSTLKQIFSEALGVDDETSKSPEHNVRLAAAALMIEIARADFQVDADELRRIESLLSESLDLSEKEIVELVSLAQQESQEATSLHEFTQLINQNYSAEDKNHLMEFLWKVAYADGDLDKYEEYMLRKIADLLYLSHAEYIKAKLKVQEGL